LKDKKGIANVFGSTSIENQQSNHFDSFKSLASNLPSELDGFELSSMISENTYFQLPSNSDIVKSSTTPQYDEVQELGGFEPSSMINENTYFQQPNNFDIVKSSTTPQYDEVQWNNNKACHNKTSFNKSYMHLHHNMPSFQPQHIVPNMPPQHNMCDMQPQHNMLDLQPQHYMSSMQHQHNMPNMQPQPNMVSMQHQTQRNPFYPCHCYLDNDGGNHYYGFD
jgi:hypothetical protein